MAPVLEPLDEGWHRALAVAAHPDDLEYGTASAIARWTSQGKDVRYVLATRGEAGIDSVAPDEARRLRTDEELASARAVGVEVVDFLDLPDGLLQADLQLRRLLAGSIRHHRPEVIISVGFSERWSPDGPYNHSDHRALGIALIDATRDAANRWLFPDAGERWDGVRWLAFAAGSPATHGVDVTDSISAGIASLRCHRVYIEALGDEFDAEVFLRENAGRTGESMGVRYAVSFSLVPT